MILALNYCSKHKAALTKYKNKLNEKEAQLKQTENGLVKMKKDSSTKLSAADDEVCVNLLLLFRLLLSTNYDSRLLANNAVLCCVY
jgi:hypothetical protein